MFLFPPATLEEGTIRFQIVTDDRAAYLVHRKLGVRGYRVLLRGLSYYPAFDHPAGDEETSNRLRSLLKVSRQTVEAKVLEMERYMAMEERGGATQEKTSRQPGVSDSKMHKDLSSTAIPR
jgi:hypothetical protein